MKDLLALETPPKVTFTEFNVQQEKGVPHFIRLNDGVVGRLERQLKDGAAADQHGLLLGSVDAADSCTICVEDYEPVDALEDRLLAWKSGASGQVVVGYYRSHIETGFKLSAGDRALFERGFPKGSRLALLVRPAKVDIGTARFFLGENGRLAVERATVEFPFNLRELGAEEAPVPPPAPVVVPKASVSKPVAADPTILKSVPAAPAPVASKSKGGAVNRILVKVAFAGVVVIASVFGLSELRVFDQPAADPKPAPAVVNVQPAPVQTPVTTAPVAETPNPVESKSLDPKPATPTSAPATAAPVKAKPDPSAAKRDKPASDNTGRQMLLAENRMPKPAISQPLIPAPPVVAPSPQVLPKAASPVVVPPPASIEIQNRAALTPPRAIRSYPPVLTEALSRGITGEVRVSVKVTVDESGRITGVEPVEGNRPVPPGLARLAAAAVRRWEFEPARRGAERVPGDITLSFIFRK